MGSRARYDADDVIATVTLDDGKVNALSSAMQREINDALDLAEGDTTQAVVLAGNAKVFCAGFDLAVFASGDRQAALDMLTGGFQLAVRLLTFPKPVIIAATGPAIAMGAFLLLSADHRIGSGRTRCQANEVAIGLALPTSAIEIMRMRLTPGAFHVVSALATMFSGEPAVAAGWLDEIVEPYQVLFRAREVAAEAAANLDLNAHAISKVRARAQAVQAIEAGIDVLDSEFIEPTPKD